MTSTVGPLAHSSGCPLLTAVVAEKFMLLEQTSCVCLYSLPCAFLILHKTLAADAVVDRVAAAV